MEGKRYPTPILLDKGSVYSNPVRHSVYVYENPDGSRMERTFREAQGFDKGLAEVEEELSEDEVFFGYIDSTGRRINRENAEVLMDIYNDPSYFLNLNIKHFFDSEFVSSAILQVKNSLLDVIEDKSYVDKDYVEYCEDLLSAVKNRVEKEMTYVEEIKKYREGIKSQVEAFKFFKDIPSEDTFTTLSEGTKTHLKKLLTEPMDIVQLLKTNYFKSDEELNYALLCVKNSMTDQIEKTYSKKDLDKLFKEIEDVAETINVNIEERNKRVDESEKRKKKLAESIKNFKV